MKFLLTLALSLNAWSDVMRVAHRGAPHFAPENTIASFQKAVELKGNYIETDIQPTADGKLVLMHDSTLDRTTNGSGKVTESLWRNVALLDAGKGLKVPTLEDLLKAAGSWPEVKLILELKYDDPVSEKRVVDMVKAYGLQSRVILKSFSYPMLQRLRLLIPEVQQVYVFIAAFPALGFMVDTFIRFQNPLDLNVEYVQSHHLLTSTALVREAHRRGKKIIIWGVEDSSDMDAWVDAGADGVETDRLDLLDQVLGKKKATPKGGPDRSESITD